MATSEQIHTDQPNYTIREMRNAIYSFNQNNAPVTDGIYHRMIISRFYRIPNTLLEMYNSAFRLPAAWKGVELVYFRKECMKENEYTS